MEIYPEQKVLPIEETQRVDFGNPKLDSNESHLSWEKIVPVLAETVIGAEVLKYAKENNLSIKYGDLSENTAGYYDRENRAIIINKNYADQSPAELSGIVVHEITHDYVSQPDSNASPIHRAVYNGVNRAMQTLFPHVQEHAALRAEADFGREVQSRQNLSEESRLKEAINIVYTEDGGLRSTDSVRKELEKLGYQGEYARLSNVDVLPSKWQIFNNITELNPFVENILAHPENRNLKGDSRKLAKSMNAEFDVEAPAYYAAHHLIPSELADMQVLRNAEALGFDINNASNGIFLPGTGKEGMGKEISQKTDQPYHTKNIAEYTDHVKANLKLMEQTFKKLHDQQGQGKSMDDFLRETGHDKTLMLNIINLQNQLRAELITQDRKNDLLISGSDPRLTKDEINEKRQTWKKTMALLVS